MKRVIPIILIFFLFTTKVFSQVNGPATPKKDSNKSFIPYILLSGGSSSPGNNYGSTFYSPNNMPFPYAGFASKGTSFSITGGLEKQNVAEIAAMFTYYHHPFDANGFLNENAEWFIDGSVTPNNNVIVLPSVSIPGNYAYNNYSFMFKFTKSWGEKIVSFGISLLGGVTIVNRPALNGTARYVINGNDSGSCHYDIDSYSQAIGTLGLGTNVRFNVIKNLFIDVKGDFEICWFKNAGVMRLTDMNGNDIWDGNVGNSGRYNSTTGLTVGASNLSVGVGYYFRKKASQ